MCGRLTQFFTEATLTPVLATSQIDFKTAPFRRFNVAPSESLGVLYSPFSSSNQLVYTETEWGLNLMKTPVTQPTKTKTFRMFNKRIETVSKKPFFNYLWQHHRLIVPVSGWYEWSRAPSRWNSRPIPYYFTREHPFFLCGLWQNPAQSPPLTQSAPTRPPLTNPTFSTTGQSVILTTAACGLAQKIHDRMPLILPKNLLSKWLHAEPISQSLLKELLGYQKTLSDQLEIFSVSHHVNSTHHKDIRCIEKATHDTELTFF